MADDAGRLFQAFVNEDPSTAIDVIERARVKGMTQDQLFDRLFAPAMSMLGGAWAAGVLDEYRFTQAAVVAEQVTSFVAPPATSPDTGITVVLGVMQGDPHDVLKNICASALKEAGHRVLDLGADVPPAHFLDRVEETGARVVMVFAETFAAARGLTRVRDMFVSADRTDVALYAAGAPFVAAPHLASEAGVVAVVSGAESALQALAERARVAAGTSGEKGAAS